MSHYSTEEPIDPQPASERTFGRYRLAYQLASGGMGTVYLARAEGPAGFEKLVALKRIHPHMANDKRFVSMFLDEARIAARIQHPNVCSVIDFGEVDGSYFLTMPFIVGESMNRAIATAAKLKDGPLLDVLPLIAARMVCDACEGLHAAHELRDDGGRPLDVVHRDVSPHNLMVGYDGVVRVLDFGVASAKHRHHQTATGEVKGKFAYLAPEQIEALPADRRADVWALGVVLWEGVMARRLFARESMAATVRAVAEMPVPSVCKARPNAPAGLDDIIAKALARDPAQRYPTARAMGRDLQQLLAKEDRFVAAAEVAEWMEQLLPQGLRAQEKLVEATRTGKLVEPTPSPPPPVLDQSSIQRRPSTDAIEGTTDVPAPRARSKLPIVAAVLGVLATMALGIPLGVWWATRSPAEEMRAVRLAEPAREVPAPEPSAAVVQEAPVIAPPVIAPPVETEVVETEVEDVAAEEEVAAVEDVAPAPSVEARAPDEAPRPRRNGTLTVATPGGWALVFLGRRQLGETPGVFTIPSGAQTIALQPFGRGPRITRRVVIPEDGTARISVPLSR